MPRERAEADLQSFTKALSACYAARLNLDDDVFQLLLLAQRIP
jgi:hypothetical protein